MPASPSTPARGRPAFGGKALVAVALWGGSLPAIRVALETFHPVGLVAVRMVVGAVLLAAIHRLREGGRLPAEGRNLLAPVFLGTVLGLHMLVQSYGLLHTSAINTGWILGFIPVAIALGARLFLRQRLPRLGWGGVALATFGILLVTLEKPPDFARARLGDALALVTCLTWTVYTLAASAPVRRHGALGVTALSAGVAAVVTTAASLGTGFLVGPLTLRTAAALSYLSLLCSGVAYLLWYQALRERGAVRTGAMLYAEPFFTLAIAAVWLGEPITWNALAGGAIVLVGVWLVGRR